MSKNKTKLEKLKEEIFSLDVTGYSTAIDRPEEIIANLFGVSSVLRNLIPQTGAKANTTVELNILTTDVVFSNADCVNTATGADTVLAPRTVSMKRLTDREELCLDKLDAKLPKIQSAGAYNDELPFAGQYMDLKVSEAGKALELIAFQGNTAIVGATNNLNKATGWLAIANAETAKLNHYATIAAADLLPADILATVQGLINTRSAEMMIMEDVKIFMSLPLFGTLQQAILTAYGIYGAGNFVNNGDQNQAGVNSFMFPGTNVTIVGTYGMTGNSSLFMTSESNLRYLTDMESDKETVELFFDKYHKALVSEIVFAIGFQYEFPELVSYLKFA